MFIKEANGLKELSKANAIRIPEVLSFDEDYILLDYIPTGNRKKIFFEDFGRSFAEMHKYSSDNFGFYEDNYIGSNPQINIPDEKEKLNWTLFYFNKRILFQLQLAERFGNATEELRKAISKLEDKIEDIIKGSKENSNGGDFQNYIYFKPLKQEMNTIFNTAYEKAIKGLNKTKIDTGSYPVMLSPDAVGLLIEEPITTGINGELVFQKRSFLLDKINQNIGSEELTIIDDPWLAEGVSTSAFDCEGTPTRPLKIIENGILKSFIHNTYSAYLLNTESTGHASRDLYSASIGIDVSNIIVQPGTIPKEEMISDIKRGIYLDNTYDSPNIVTGEFSGLITNGYLIENGSIGKCLRETMFGINLLELFSNIKAISKETTRISASYLPYISINKMTISGAENNPME
jgi:hypothetical protein